MRFIYQYPEAAGTERDMLESGAVTDIAAGAEAAGWDGIAFTEHPAPGARWLEAGGHQTLDPFVALAAAAAVTTRIRLITYLSVAPYRNPLLLAKAAATLDRVSAGRFVLGLGTGYLRGEFRALGVEFDDRNQLFDEALEVMPKYWSGEPFDHEGLHFTAKQIQGRPAPLGQIPIWIGGNAAITRRRVAERAHGWMPLGGPAEFASTTRTPALGGLEGLASGIDEIRELAGERGAALDFVFLYPDPTLTTEPGTDVERHREAVGRLADIGLTHLVCLPPSATPPSQTLEWIEAAVATLQG